MAKSIATGDVYGVKLGTSSFGLVHVVWTKPAWKHTSLVFLDWFGPSNPTLADAAKTAILTFRHPELAGEAGWLRNLRGATAPTTFTRLGTLKPSKAALALPLGDTWDDPAQRHRTTDWRAVPHTLVRELAYRTDPQAAMATRLVPGSVVAIETAQGFVAVLVLRVTGRVEEEKHAKFYELAVFKQLFDKQPTLAEAVRALKLPALKSPHSLVRSAQEVPDEAIQLGTVKLPRLSVTLDDKVSGQWPWSAKRAARVERKAAARKAPSLTLATVKPLSLFTSWKKASAGDRKTARTIIAALVKVLRAVTAPTAKRTAILRAIKAFNATDFIETYEREDICRVLQALGESAGLPASVVEHLIDAKRDF